MPDINELTRHEKYIEQIRVTEKWTMVRFSSNDLTRVHNWIKKNATGRYSLSIMSVRFENPHDATFFKLTFQDD